MCYVRGLPKPDSSLAGKTSWVLVSATVHSVPSIKVVLGKYLFSGNINQLIKTNSEERNIRAQIRGIYFSIWGGKGKLVKEKRSDGYHALIDKCSDTGEVWRKQPWLKEYIHQGIQVKQPLLGLRNWFHSRNQYLCLSLKIMEKVFLFINGKKERIHK